MVALGRIPSNPTPPWIRITPAIKGAVALVGHDDSDLHAGSRRAAAARDALHGRRSTPRRPACRAAGCAKPYRVLVHDADRPADVGALGAARDPLRRAGDARAPIQPARAARRTSWRTSRRASAARRASRRRSRRPSARCSRRSDPDGLKRFDAKVAARAPDRRPARCRRRCASRPTGTASGFPPNDAMVVLETAAAPPPGAWLQLTMDARMPSPDGPALPPNAADDDRRAAEDVLRDAARAVTASARRPATTRSCSPSRSTRRASRAR